MIRTMWGVALAVGTACAAVFATPATAGAAKPLFASEDVIHLTLRGEVNHLRSARADTDTIDGTLSVVGTPDTLPVKLTARGVTRRLSDVCQFPPLRVTFAQPPGAGSLFAGQKKLKLVTHCQQSQQFRHFLLLEYAAYRLYNVLTPQSFRARLAMIDYVDGAGKPIITRYGFFLEDAGDVAKRNDLHQIKLGERIPVATLDPATTARFSVFEYMIGNLDWATNGGEPGSPCCHNARLIGAKDATTDLIPVPYDFDFSGLVDAPYAQPPEAVKVPNVRTRRYRGFCRHNDPAQAAAADLLAKRPALMAALDTVPDLAGDAKKKADDYLTGFFARIATPRDVSANLLATCI